MSSQERTIKSTLLDLRSALPKELLSAHGSHRYFTDDIEHTRSLVAQLESESKPVFALECVYGSGFKSAPQSQERGRISYVQAGLMSAITDKSAFIVPAGHAIWIPPALTHLNYAAGHIRMLSAYMTIDNWPDPPETCSVFQASELIEPLLKHLIAHQLRQKAGPIHEALLLLLKAEISDFRKLGTDIQMPRDPRLRRVCSTIIRDPTIWTKKEELARLGHMSCRTMTRLFKTELDMTFLEWVQQVLIISALGRLARGDAVANIASDLGYCSVSAFTAMFRRRIGRTPSDFRSRRRP